MKTSGILKLAGVVLIGLTLTAQVNANERRNNQPAKKALNLQVDKPLVEYLAKASESELDAKDIVRMQKSLSKIDHVTVSFLDKDASDYILKFKPLDVNGLEVWMFDEGYLGSSPANHSVGSTVPAEEGRSVGQGSSHHKRKSIPLSIDRPLIGFLSHAFAGRLDAADIMRIQKVVGQVDHVTVSFIDADAPDYVLNFRSMDEKELESWMFDEGYLYSAPESRPTPEVPWMSEMHLN